jgi:hypothetical protein
VGEPDYLGQTQDGFGRFLVAKARTLRGMPFANEAAQVAPFDVLILQTGRVGSQVGIPQLHNAGMLSLLHHLIQDGGLVQQQPVFCVRVEAEFERHRGYTVEMRIAGLPDFAEAAGA